MHFARLLPLCADYSKYLQLKTRHDVPHQKVTNKIVDKLKSKTMHFYNLLFALDTRTYYKIRQDFFIRNLYKYLHLYIMSCRVCSARREIPFNQKQRSWSSQVIHDFAIMESISMDLKVMPTSFCGYNYLLVMRCNHSCFIITETLKTRKASEVAESLFQKLWTNNKEIYCNLDNAFKNEMVSTLFKTLDITVTFCNVQSH